MILEGQHSTFFFYPKFNKILLAIVSQFNSQSFLFNGSFVVIDQNLVCSIPVPICVFIKQPDFLYLINVKYILSFYFLKVSKLDQITVVILSLSDPGCIIYNRPGILSRTLKCQHIQKCSTFQCILLLLMHNFKTRKSYINYYSVLF